RPRPDAVEVHLAREVAEGVLRVVGEEVAERARGEVAGEEVLDVLPVVVGEGAGNRPAGPRPRPRPLADAGGEGVEPVSQIVEVWVGQRPLPIRAGGSEVRGSIDP